MRRPPLPGRDGLVPPSAATGDPGAATPDSFDRPPGRGPGETGRRAGPGPRRRLRAGSLGALIAGALLLILPAARPTPAAAAAQCAERADLVRQLEQRYGEVQRALGISGGRSLIEVFASDATGTWTILITRPDGRACLMATGESFEAIPTRAPDLPA